MNTRSSSPLRHLDISDTTVAADMVAEKARELSAAYERIEELQAALKDLLWLAQSIAVQAKCPPAIREALTTNNRVIDAIEVLR
jgi:hypothetical protein